MLNIIIFDNGPKMPGVKVLDARELTTGVDVAASATAAAQAQAQVSVQTQAIISPANSLGFMDGGIELVYMKGFPDVQDKVYKGINLLGVKSLLNRPCLPVGYAMGFRLDSGTIFVSAPTMLVPMNVEGTRNPYNAMRAAVYLLQSMGVRKAFASLMCTGYGHITRPESLQQMKEAIAAAGTPTGLTIVKKDEYTYCVPSEQLRREILLDQPHAYAVSEWIEQSDADLQEKAALPPHQRQQQPQPQEQNLPSLALDQSRVHFCAAKQAQGKDVILVLTGSFSPPHVGHTQMLEASRLQLEREGLHVAGAFLCPSDDSYVRSKLGADAWPMARRAALCHLAVQDSDWISVCDWGINNGFKVAKKICKALAGGLRSSGGANASVQVYPVMGADTYERYAFDSTVQLPTDVVIVPRKGSAVPAAKPGVHVVQGEQVADISSSEIRDRIAAGESLEGIVETKVAAEMISATVASASPVSASIAYASPVSATP